MASQLNSIVDVHIFTFNLSDLWHCLVAEHFRLKALASTRWGVHAKLNLILEQVTTHILFLLLFH